MILFLYYFLRILFFQTQRIYHKNFNCRFIFIIYFYINVTLRIERLIFIIFYKFLVHIESKKSHVNCSILIQFISFFDFVNRLLDLFFVNQSLIKFIYRKILVNNIPIFKITILYNGNNICFFIFCLIILFHCYLGY